MLDFLKRDRIMSEITGAPLCKENQLIDDFFEEMFSDINYYNRDDIFIHFTKGKCTEFQLPHSASLYMKYDISSMILYCSYHYILIHFITIGIESDDILEIIKEKMVEKFNLEIKVCKKL